MITKQDMSEDSTSVSSGSTSADWMNDIADMTEKGISDHANNNENETNYDDALFNVDPKTIPNQSRSKAWLPSQVRAMICIGLFLLMILLGIMIGAIASRTGHTAKAEPASQDSQLTPTTTASSSTTHSSSKTTRSVAFDHRYNVAYDGIQLIKNNTSGANTYVFDAYAKTTEPVTELKIYAADTQYTRQILLTTKATSGYEYGGDPFDNASEETKYETPVPDAVVRIGFYRNGELWLPPNQSLQSYTANDFFTLNIRGDIGKIVLYKNDEALTEYPNPYVGQPLYAQVWLKEPNASMRVVATEQSA